MRRADELEKNATHLRQGMCLLRENFDKIQLFYMLRGNNERVDGLAKKSSHLRNHVF
jgi:hypothetical protein